MEGDVYIQKQLEEINKLNKVHSDAKNSLLKKQNDQKTELEQRIMTAIQAVQNAHLSLEKRTREIELEKQRVALKEMVQLHSQQSNELLKQQEREINSAKGYLDTLRKYLQADSMIIELLEELRLVKHLQQTTKRDPIPYEFKYEKEILFQKKQIITETRYKKLDEIPFSLQATRINPNTWQVGGRIPNGCVLIFTVEHGIDRFKVTGESDASWERGTKATEPIDRQHMRGPQITTANLSREALTDALAHVMVNTSEVCPCLFGDCPCACDCDCACHDT